MLSNLDLPKRRHTPAALAPFQPRRIASAELGSDIVYRFPGKSGHADLMGPTVPYVKAELSRDNPVFFCKNRSMSEWLSQKEFEDRLIKRTARLRTTRGWTQEEMAKAIGIAHERYKKYETRSPMPHFLIPRFAMHVGRDIEYVLTGEEPSNRRGPRVIRTGTDG